MNILQWNICGLKPKMKNGDIPCLIKKYQCPVLVFQETKLSEEQIFKIKGYKSYLKSLPTEEGEKAHGGVGIFVKNYASSYSIPLNTNLQAVAVSVKIHKRVSICSLYLPPRKEISKEDIQNIINQLPKPFLLLGDFNAHHRLWYDQREIDQRGKKIVEIIADNDVGLLDRNKPTCIWNTDKSYSHIDLSIASSDIIDDFYWDTHEEPMNSDHFPILLNSERSILEDRPPRWITEKAKWQQYQELAVVEENQLKSELTVDQVTTLLEENINKAAEISIPKTSGKRGAANPAWWNTRCRKAINKRKATFRRFNKVSTTENYISYKKARAQARKEIIESKKECWIRFLESINSKTTSKEVWRRIRILLNKYKGETLTTLKLTQPAIKISNIPLQNKHEIIEELCNLGCIQSISTEENNNPSTLTVTIRYEQNNQNEIIRKYDGKTISSKQIKAEILSQEKTQIIDDQKEIANCLGRRFQYISSNNYRSNFNETRKESEREKIDFSTMNNMKYNGRITEEELEYVLEQSKDSTPGKDEITYSMIKNLGTKGKEQFLYLLNKIFNEGKFPDKWKEAYIIPILKNGKESIDPTAYRPIALTSCACKILEKILNRRLLWFLESKGYFHKNLSGFRIGRNTTDSLATLINQIHAAFRHKQYIISVFLDLEKAYDTCWRHLIIKELYNMGLRGKLPIIITDYLKDRKFQVKIGTNLSETFVQEIGVPQGGVLSCTLFNIAMNTVMKTLSGLVSSSVYVDDIRTSYANTNPIVCQTRMQIVLNNLQHWAENNGFKFNTEKTEWMFFYRNIREPKNISLTLYGKKLKQVQEKKFLGVILDRILNWKKHIEHIKTKSLREMNILYVISRGNKAITNQMLISIYKTLIKSRLEYAIEIIGTAPKTALEALDPVHHKALRICLGAHPSSPIESLYALSGESRLSQRRMQLMLQYYIRMKQFLPHERPINLDDRTMDAKYDENSNKPISLGYTIRKNISAKNIEISQIATYRGMLWCNSNTCLHDSCEKGPWNSTSVNTCLTLSKVQKEHRIEEEWTQIFLKHKHEAEIEVYTDGSKAEEEVGAACIIMKNNKIIASIQRKLPKQATVFTAELIAIKIAITFLRQNKIIKSTIYTDSLSAVLAIKKKKSNHLVTEIHEIYTSLKNKNSNTTICWIPSHVGIAGNELADRAAKEALNIQQKSHPILPAKDMKTYIKNIFKQQRKTDYNEINTNQLWLKHTLTEIKTRPPATNLVREDNIKITRLQIGHTDMTHNYLYKNEPKPRCNLCAEILTVKHILLECDELKETRKKYLPENLGIKQMLTQPYVIDTIKFLKETGHYRRI